MKQELKQSRYSRQMLFTPIGEEGQKRLGQSRVLIVGMGALGTVLANHMVRAGVGHVRFIDRDFVEPSNLQRQMLFDEQDAAQSLPKAIAAERKLKQINSEIHIEGIVGDLTAANIDQVAHEVDLILDGTDNFQTRFLMNDYAFKHGIPYVYGGVVAARGMQATFIPGETPCLRCLIDEGQGTGETCDTSGVIAPVVDIIASYQATEALKLLVGKKEAVRSTLLSFDLWHGFSHDIKLRQPKTGCLTCQKKEYPALEIKEEGQITSLCGRETVQITPSVKRDWDLKEWKKRLEKVGKVELTPFLLRADIDDLRLVLFTDGRVLVQGTEDVTRAKAVYARYIGM
ncbi:UBA/THIF-type NAD/FAD binding protein [Caldalkalibacillus thermarum TA2.A1]|uniref:ThiF family adenylyltransferase n=1 Tax=Caldalkalibacillus thermarum (strain TA2.A1) TaxID=986075 RepID=F5LAH4_CALTT|nr:ThiF family adenylyltransferase [Caldalkalibacillus thermarum]EGL81723.1 UBA/THIF-type NAD/FAD binding protein [Caldalkalibacillus thermarum TA2.A1]QZT33308.1 ThiF family adenylyltransferase [Caldalkalibacillus thermarum TA2.A1]